MKYETHRRTVTGLLRITYASNELWQGTAQERELSIRDGFKGFCGGETDISHASKETR
jgi:hypothetical protein